VTERDEQKQYSRDEGPVGWGDERSDPERAGNDPDLERLLADRPPHHDRD
jgi:hypothetical protein